MIKESCDSLQKKLKTLTLKHKDNRYKKIRDFNSTYRHYYKVQLIELITYFESDIHPFSFIHHIFFIMRYICIISILTGLMLGLPISK